MEHDPKTHEPRSAQAAPSRHAGSPHPTAAPMATAPRRPELPDPREVLRAARAEALGHSMARRVF